MRGVAVSGVDRRLSKWVSRRKALRIGGLLGAGVAFAAACGRDKQETLPPLPRAGGQPPTAPGSSTSLVQPGVQPAVASEIDVTVSISDMRGFLQQAQDQHRTYFDTVRAQQGDAAAQQEQNAFTQPYQDRINRIQAAGGTETIRVPLVTIWGALTFSARSFEGPLEIKDPVSILFFWDGVAGQIYDRSLGTLTCRPDQGEQCRHTPRWQDEDDRQGIPGHPFRCHTTPQYVLIGNAGGPLQWTRNTSGMMKEIDRCNRTGRDHIRVFGGPRHPVFGNWSVATPHQERFSVSPRDPGHVITSWNKAQRLYAGSWIESNGRNDAEGWDPTVYYWDQFDWGTEGYYQRVHFDGQGFVIGLDLPSAT